MSLFKGKFQKLSAKCQSYKILSALSEESASHPTSLVSMRRECFKLQASDEGVVGAPFGWAPRCPGFGLQQITWWSPKHGHLGHGTMVRSTLLWFPNAGWPSGLESNVSCK